MSIAQVHRVRPLEDRRWAELVERHPRASVFHSPEWLDALRRTYGYEPIALTTTAPGEDLTNGIVFCQVQSWLTGRRMVSLPFSDHCEPLVERVDELEQILSAVERDVDARQWRYLEIRPRDRLKTRVPRTEGEVYVLHLLKLCPSPEELFRRFHKDCIQRKIRRAEREALTLEEGCSEALLQKFYQLLMLTRRRQRLPPQPLSWFRNLIECMGDKLNIRLASKNGRPIASILTLQHKGTLVYKYGCSDKRFSSVGGTHLLFWKAILEAKNRGLTTFDLGRSNLDNHGLIDFKDRWGATRSELAYLRYPPKPSRAGSKGIWVSLLKQIVALAPHGLVTTAGRVFYRHIG